MNFPKVQPLFVSIPHSGEQVPSEVTWLQNLPEVTLMRDVDRFVDKLYEKALEKTGLHCIQTQWHRYVVDLNRLPDDFDAGAVVGAEKAAGTSPKGLHWCVTTQQEILLEKPMSQELHKTLLKNHYEPFHQEVQKHRDQVKAQYGRSFHLDLHSMPSVGTSLHPDPGQTRADVVISDYHGTTAGPEFRDIVMRAYQDIGWQVAYNWPYVGGGITRMYGQPNEGYNTIQVELNRRLYMNEDNKRLIDDQLVGIQKKLESALQAVKVAVEDLA